MEIFSFLPLRRLSLALLLLFVQSWTSSSGAVVTNIKASCRSGQVFITWTNPSGSNFQYNVYRSTTPFTASNQLTSSTYLGFVRDSSSKNIRLSTLSVPVFYKIKKDASPLLSTQGLYVATCIKNKSYYYAVTVTKLSNNSEAKTLTAGSNTLSAPVSESVKTPQPVYQFTEIWLYGDTVDRYVQFVDNQETALYPAMNNTGSYGFNFYLMKRGSATKYPLIVLFEELWETSITGNGKDEFQNKDVNNCYILGVDDWVPVPQTNGTLGSETHWFGYQENFNIYSNTNPIPVSGVVKSYTQRRYIQALHWVEDNFSIDKSRVYTVGVSAGGYGALMTATLIPDEIAAVYAVVEPFSGGTTSDIFMEMWGDLYSELSTDILDWQTGQPIKVGDILRLSSMMEINQGRDLPILFDIHGKNDETVIWTEGTTTWYDSMRTHHDGGVSYWDQRMHDGTGANFTDKETTPDFYRYQTNKSFPAFSNCSIDQNAGDGSPASGAQIGSINGYLDWKDDIEDKACSYKINLLLKDFYVGGVLYQDQYNTCTTDIAFRRLQNFKPMNGDVIKWKNFDASNNKIQSGTITFDGNLLKLKGIIVNKAGNQVTLTIQNCTSRVADEDAGDAMSQTEDSPVYFTKSADGYRAHINVTENQSAEISMIDLLGRRVMSIPVNLNAGMNEFDIPSIQPGIFLVVIKNDHVFKAERLLF